MDIIGKSTIHPVLFYTGKIAGYMIWIVLLLEVFGVDLFEGSNNVYLIYISYIAAIIGVLFIIISLFNLGSSIRLGLPQEDTVLKTGGIYKFSRNPMYVGFNLLTIAGMVHYPDPIIIILGLYSLTTYHLIILSEERFLHKRFGEEFDRYKIKARRYF
jgi:protein-S-isoprenylcysteine O-methyltransferase Ste14